MGQGIFLMFLRLLALRNGSSESLDAGHVRYSVAVLIRALSKVVATDIQTRQRPIILEVTADNERAFNTETLAADVQLGDGFVSERNGTENLHRGLSFDQSDDLVHVLNGDAVVADVKICHRPIGADGIGNGVYIFGTEKSQKVASKVELVEGGIHLEGCG